MNSTHHGQTVEYIRRYPGDVISKQSSVGCGSIQNAECPNDTFISLMGSNGQSTFSIVFRGDNLKRAGSMSIWHSIILLLVLSR